MSIDEPLLNNMKFYNRLYQPDPRDKKEISISELETNNNVIHKDLNVYKITFKRFSLKDM